MRSNRLNAVLKGCGGWALAAVLALCWSGEVRGQANHPGSAGRAPLERGMLLHVGNQSGHAGGLHRRGALSRSSSNGFIPRRWAGDILTGQGWGEPVALLPRGLQQRRADRGDVARGGHWPRAAAAVQFPGLQSLRQFLQERVLRGTDRPAVGHARRDCPHGGRPRHG